MLAVMNSADLQKTDRKRTNAAGRKRRVSRRFSSHRRDRGHAPNVSHGRSLKAARSGTQGATVHTQYRGMTEGSRSARSRPSQVNGHCQRVGLIHCGLLAAAASPQQDTRGSAVRGMKQMEIKFECEEIASSVMSLDSNDVNLSATSVCIIKYYMMRCYTEYMTTWRFL